MAKPEGRLVTQAELVSIIGRTAVTIRTWEALGCPVEIKGHRGRASRYDTAKVIRWREDQIKLAAMGDAAAIDYEEARRRKTVAEAVLAEVEADERKGEVVQINDVVTAVVGEYAIVRNKLLGIGSRIAPRAAAARKADIVKELIDAEVTRTLTELSEDEKWKTLSEQKRKAPT